MNSHISKLQTIAKKKSRLIIGLMSGTSLDGLDIALCKINGAGTDTKISLLQFATITYKTNFKNEIKTVFSKEKIDFKKLCVLNETIAIEHSRIINECLKKWKVSNNKIDLIASHGQTVYHAPKSLERNKKQVNATLQIGDGDHIAVKTGIITVSDFRQKHLAAGGEGAPLAGYGDYLLFRQKKKNTILLNIGGIANFTFIPANSNFSDIICSDTGPGNTLMDAWVQRNYKGKYYDDSGLIAKKGKVNQRLLETLKSNIFFKVPIPKTTGQETFNLEYVFDAQKKSNTLDINSAEMLATLNKLTADTICESINKVTHKKSDFEIIMSGGGAHNKLLVSHVRNFFKGVSVETTVSKNINPDAKEAILFALLANELIAGNETTFGKGSKSMPNVKMGKISLPK